MLLQKYYNVAKAYNAVVASNNSNILWVCTGM